MKHLVFGPKQRKASLLPSFLLGSLFAFLLTTQAWGETGDHHQAYLDALDTVIASETRIEAEMERISNGAVAHYDFLQHEHIELLRHANALRHPPTQMSVSQHDAVIARADALLMAAESVELVIADFLRAQALLSSAVSNTLDLLATQPNQSQTNADLGNLQQLAHAAREFRTNNTTETREVLYAAFDEVASLDIGQTWQSELSVQRRLIRNNAAQAVQGKGKLAMAEVTSLAEVLQATYLAAMTETRQG